MEIVCFDTQVIVWGIKQKATPGQEDMVAKAKFLIEQCKKEETAILIPALVVAELLMPLPTEEYGTFTALLHKNFRVIPFDTRAAAIFANLWKDWQKKKNKLPDSFLSQATRAEMKTDYMIIATALAQGATCIYSEDRKLKKFAEEHLKVVGLPTTYEQRILGYDDK
ncbi:MAG: PIN domain-containing protein [Cyanobacteria bacterium J06597_16]